MDNYIPATSYNVSSKIQQKDKQREKNPVKEHETLQQV